MLESVYQGRLKVRIENETLPGSLVLKNDSGFLQGIPDLSIFYGDRYAFLEVKPSADAPFQPNQPYYIDLLNRMSFAAVIYPENEEVVLDALQSALAPRR